MRDGTFGVTSRVEPFEDELIRALETHQFEPVKTVQWRNRDLDFSSIEALKESLDLPPSVEGLTKAPPAVDVEVLDTIARDPAIAPLASSRDLVCGSGKPARFPTIERSHRQTMPSWWRRSSASSPVTERSPTTGSTGRSTYADHAEGDIDTLSNRIAHIRTWTFVANRPNWLDDPMHWQERARAVEDRLSDALHERLTARFVDRRTSVLMRRLKEKAMLEAEITPTGDVLVEGQHVGRLAGFRFEADASADGTDVKALRAAATKALSGEITERAEKVATSPNGDFVLASDGTLRWRGGVIARIAEGETALKPRLILLADDALASGPRERVQARIDLWLANRIETLLKPLIDLGAAESLSPAARGIAFRLVENLGVVDRAEIAEEVRSLDQESRAGMRALGVRFGAHHIYAPALLKPGPAALLAVLWSVKNGGVEQAADLIQLASSGRTSFKVDPAFPRPLYRVVGYRVAGNMAVRVDIIERLADCIRPLIAWRPTPEAATPPDGAADGNGFRVTVTMTSLLGCSGEDFASVLRALGYRMERRPAPAPQAAAEAATASVTETELPPGEPVAAASDVGDGAPTDGAGTAPSGAEDTASTDGEVEPLVEAVMEADAALSAMADAETAAPEAEAPATEAIAEASGADATPASADDAVSIAVAVVEAASTDTPAEAAPEPTFIEIWRPQRFGRRPDQRKPRQRPSREGQPQGDAAPVQTEAQGPRPPRREHRKDSRRGEGPGGDQQGRPSRHGPRPERSARPERQDRPNRPPERPPERQKQADPLSPFAALAALKAQLEAQKRDGQG